MPEREHCLPSGLTGIVKPWKTGDLAVFTDRRLARIPGPTFEAELAKRSWVKTEEMGPYAFEGRPTWMKDVLSGDLFDLTRVSRILTWGPEYVAEFECNGKTCDAAIEVEIDLNDVKVKPLSDEAVQMFLNGNRFPYTLPECGTEILYALPTGSIQAKADKLAKQHGRHLHVILAARLQQVEGIESPGRFVQWLSDLSAVDGVELEHEMDRLNPGVDTEVDMVCSECGRAQSQDMSFGPSFFTPDRKRRKKLTD